MIAFKDNLDSEFVERVRAFFSENGPLSKAKNFEFRPEQQEMAARVAQALEEERHLVLEAGTGVGKSLAYLVPAILFALEQDKKAIVSTHTINLQEQLLHKDIPILKKVLPVEFEAALMKGRQNYLCPRRLERAVQNANELFTGPEESELQRLAEWASTTRDGSLSDLSVEPDPKVWTQVCSEAHICTQKTCGQNPRCFYQQARKRLLAADVIVLNHTLLFILLGSPDQQEERESGFLFPNDFIILDEAHTVEQVASRQIGIGVSEYGLRSTIQRLYNSRTRKGLFTVTRDADGVRLAAELIDDVEKFFAAVESKSDFRKGREFRVRDVDFVPDTITGRLTAPEHVYWVERTGKTERFVALNAAPVDLAPVLRRMLFRESCCCIMTSATLAVGRPDLAYFRERTGATEAEPFQLGSPFDFQRQMKMFVVQKMPDPRDAAYQKQLEHWIAHFVKKTDGRAFVLFTNYRDMQHVGGAMQKFFVENDMNLVVQGAGAPRSKLLDQFKSTPRSVLFGTDSFWGGVDVPGEALSNVIITRLPFAVPDHPLIEAKLELIEERGGDPFTEYSLPEAVLKLRQGVGRLIRTKTDQGIIVILDNRIVTKSYGKSFLQALPPCPVEMV